MLIVDPIVFHAIFAMAFAFPITLLLIAFALATSRTVGGLTFCRLGPLGFSFYIRRNA